jgi:ribonuclease HI
MPAPCRPGRFDLYTDASVEGRWLVAKGSSVAHGRSRNGPAMGAWIGWHDCEHTDRPTVAGQAYLGLRGTQSAEYMAAAHGLNAVLTYAQVAADAPADVVLHVDNQTVFKQLNREWAVSLMANYVRTVRAPIASLEAMGVVVAVVQVSEKDPVHKHAHRLSRTAWNQVFADQSWRPRGKPHPSGNA